MMKKEKSVSDNLTDEDIIKLKHVVTSVAADTGSSWSKHQYVVKSEFGDNLVEEDCEFAYLSLAKFVSTFDPSMINKLLGELQHYKKQCEELTNLCQTAQQYIEGVVSQHDNQQT